MLIRKKVFHLEYFLMVLRSGFELEKDRKAKETLKPEAEWEIATNIGVCREQS